MKRVLLFRLMATLLIAITIPLAARGEYISYTASYNLTQYMATDTLGGVTYSIVNYGDLENGGEPGKPLLPIDYLKFSVPYNATNFSVTTTLGSSITYLIDHMMYPVQPPRMMNDTTPVVITPPDSAAYFSGQFYPAQKAWVVDEGFLAGENHIVTVAVMPFAYQHTSTQDKLKKYKKVTVKLSYVINSTPSMSPIMSYNSNTRNEGYKLTQSMVVNPSCVTSFAPVNMPNDTIYKPQYAPAINTNMTAYPYLIISVSELSHSLRRLIALKKQKGYNVKLVTVDEVINDPYAQYGDIVSVNGVPTVTFTDSAGIIRQYLKMARWYNQSKYLLLAGTNVPYRKIIGFYDYVPTDLYYSDLNGNWMNGPYDKEPDYFVGRILAKSEQQISNYTNKLYRYELNPGKGNYSYLRRALYTEGINLKGGSKGIRKWMNYICPDTSLIQEIWKGRFPTGSFIVDSINSNPFGFWSTFNHGEPSCIVTYGVGAGGAYTGSMYRIWAIDSIHIAASNYPAHVSDRGLNDIRNKFYPTISYSISCTTMPYDIYKPVFQNLPMSFGESFTTGKDYGGPAYLGNTRKGYIGPSDELAERFSKKLYDGLYKLGETEAISKANYYYYHNGSIDTTLTYHISMAHNLLGDPTLEMWTDLPQVYSNIGVSRTNNAISISGIDTDSTIVSYYNNDGQIGTDTISTTSITLNGVSPNSSVMLYKHNYIPYIVPLELQNITLENSQYVIASEVTAGHSVNTNRTSGNVIIQEGIEYEIEASGKVTLEDGFRVEKGATFAVYPACF